MSRSRASTLQDPAPEVAEFRTQIQVLGQIESVPEHNGTSNYLYQKLEAAHRIRQSLLGSSHVQHLRDAFRHLNGFQTLIVALEQVSGTWTRQANTFDEEFPLSVSLLHAIFGILAAALQQHKGNQKYFRLRVKRGGWLEVKQILHEKISCKDAIVNPWSEDLTEEVFGCLLGCALNDESMTGFFQRLRRKLDRSYEPFTDSGSTQSLSPATQNAESGARTYDGHGTSRLHGILRSSIDSLTTVHHQDAILLLFELWRGLETTSEKPPQKTDQMISAVPAVINYLANLSTSNLVALHGTGLLHSVLVSLLNKHNLEARSLSEIRNLATVLLQLGAADLDDAHLLYRNARSSPMVADLLLASLVSSRSPSYINFDLSLNGFASVELPGIGKAFPPTGSNTGYTLSLWLHITQFDPNAHTTVFGAFDASQTCFVLVYLEKDTHNLILQTSVSSSRPSVRFKSVSFHQGRWYHVVIAHRRPKTTSSSRASLFVDGEFVEQVKSQYPAAAPSTNVDRGRISSPSSNRKTGAIQAFLGTPQDLASRLGRGMVSTQWRLASANLFADVLTDDLIAVYFELGPRYTGNYQDCLGSFQTYRASAALNLRNESLHPGKEERSDIVTAIRSKAGTLLPEASMLLNISANVVLDDDDHNNIDETYLLNFISKPAGKNLRNVTRGGRNALAINGAIPSINEALLHPSGFAVLTGDPTVVVPQSLDDAAWRVGGCAAVSLAILEAAHRPEEILRALKILFESVQGNWRNSEAMERENGFGVLSTILATKLGQQASDTLTEADSMTMTPHRQPSTSPLTLQVLTEMLEFVGYRIHKPEDSVINNPLAYRILLVDMEFWRSADPPAQKLYYEQFLVFGMHSKYHLFNMKRLSRMRQFPKLEISMIY